MQKVATKACHNVLAAGAAGTVDRPVKSSERVALHRSLTKVGRLAARETVREVDLIVRSAAR